MQWVVPPIGDVDRLLILPIYAANEPKPDPNLIQEIIKGIQSNTSCDIHYFDTKTKTLTFLKKTLKEGDIVITMGAGDIHQVSSQLAHHYQEKVPH